MNFYANVLEGEVSVFRDNYFLQSKEEIKKWLKEVGVKKYKMNDDLTVDVKGDVDISGKNLTKIPIKFNKINGDFECGHNKLTSLKGCPDTVKGDFDCKDNLIISFEFMPKKITGRYFFWGNDIKSVDFLVAFNENIAYFLIKALSFHSWLPLKNMLKTINEMSSIYKEKTDIVNNYINVIKGKKIKNIDEFIQELYENINNNDYIYKDFAVFCQTILKDIEKLQLY